MFEKYIDRRFPAKFRFGIPEAMTNFRGNELLNVEQQRLLATPEIARLPDIKYFQKISRRN